MKSDKAEGEIVREAIQTISKKWHSQIIYILLNKDKASFKEIKEEVEGISNKVLSGSLKDMREKELVSKNEQEDSSRYQLTKRGRDLRPLINESLKWGEKYISDSEKFNILIVEDDESQAEMYRRWLKDFHSVEIATDGAEAMENLSDDTDVIFLDRKLPDMEADEILEAAGDTLEDKYVVMLTATEPEMDIVDLDIQEYLTKPISYQEIEEVLENIEEQGQKTEKTQKLWSLAAKKSLLEEKNRIDELEKQKQYKRLKAEINNLKSELNDIPDKIRKRI